MPDLWWSMGAMGLLMFLVLLVFLALIVGGIYLLARAIRGDPGRFGSGGSTRDASRSNALSILEERYARGEIDREEFEERRRTIGG